MHSAALTSLFLLVVWTGHLPAQQQDALGPAVDFEPQVVPIHTSEPDPMGGEYGSWAAVPPIYKVSFHGDMTFVPYLGDAYPANQEVGWRTLSVRAGSQVLLAEGEVPERHHTDTRYEYRFRNVIEAYDVGLEGVEQTFVIARKPAGTGDLVVTGRLATGLSPVDRRSGHGPIDLADGGGRVLVRYGAAWAVTGDGRKIPIATDLDGDRVRLTVPGHVLDERAFPLVLDPLILTPNQVLAGGTRLRSADICRDDARNDLMVTYIAGASGFDRDAFGVLFQNDTTMSRSTVVFADTSANWRNDHISVAAAGAGTRAYYCIAIDRVFSGPIAVRFRLHASGDTRMSASVDIRINPPSTHQDLSPDVGGTALSVSGDHFMLAWTRRERVPGPNGSRVHAAPLDFSGLPGSSVAIGPIINVAPVEPGRVIDQWFGSVTQVTEVVSGRQLSWLVCWQENDQSVFNDDWDLAVRRVYENGTYSRASFFSPRYQHEVMAQIAGENGRYAVVHGRTPRGQSPGTEAYSIAVSRIDWPQGGSPTEVAYTQVLSSNSRRFTPGSVAFDRNTRSHWAFSVGDWVGNTVSLVRIGYDGQTTEGPLTLERGSASRGACTFDDDNDLVQVAWSGLADTLIRGNALGYRTPQPTVLGGIGCSSARLSWVGANPQQIGNEFSTLRVDRAPLRAPHFVLMAGAAVSVPLSIPGVGSGCRLLVPNNGPGYIGMLPLQIGTVATWRVPLPPSLSPQTLYFQDWHLNSTGTHFVSTQRLAVPIIK